MILFFRTPTKSVIATEVSQELASEDIQKLSWLYGEATVENEENLKGCFIGPRREMITPWSTNAVEITQNMGLTGVLRIEEYFPVKDENAEYDPMLHELDRTSNHTRFIGERAYRRRSGFCAARSCWGTLYTAHTEQGTMVWICYRSGSCP